MKNRLAMVPVGCLFLMLALPSYAQEGLSNADEIIQFQGETGSLGGALYRPAGDGPFPAFLFNHGSARGSLNNQAFEQIGPVFRDMGWVFFAPYRRGQGLSESAGPYIGDAITQAQIATAVRVLPAAILCAALLLYLLFRSRRNIANWVRIVATVCLVFVGAAVSYAAYVNTGAKTMVALLETDHLRDQLAALSWLRQQSFVQPDRIATGGNSFGGIITVLTVEQVPYCAAIDAAGGAQSWRLARQLRSRMLDAVRNAQAPIFFFQAENDYDLSPSRTLAGEMDRAGRENQLRIYTQFGESPAQGHSFAWRGVSVWAEDVFEFLERYCAA